MKTYLVERYSPEIQFSAGSLIIALTPQVCYQLDKAKIKHSIIEDHYDEADLSALDSEYYESQLKWINNLDEFLKNNVKELKTLGLNLGTVHYFFLKTMLIDPLYVRSYTLQKLFEAIKPTDILLISQSTSEIAPDFTLQYYNKSYYSQVIPILCRQSEIPFEAIYLEPIKPVIRHESFVTRLKSMLTGNNIIREIYLRTTITYRYLSSRLKKHPEEKRLNILLLKLTHIGINFVIDALKRGHRVYQLSDKAIIKYNSVGTRNYLKLMSEKFKARVASSGVWENTANLLEGNDLIKWVNEKCQLDVSAIVLPKLKYFITKVCPEILEYYKQFCQFYEKDQINFTITPHEVSPIELAAIAAATHSEVTKSFNVQHGDSAFAGKFWNITELTHFNMRTSPNKEVMDYLKRQCTINNIPTKLYGNSERLLKIEKINSFRKSNKRNTNKGRVIYLPTIFNYDHRRIDGQMYPDTWYYKFQKAIIEYFSTKKEYSFVWKGLPASDSIYNPIQDFIRDNKYTNIKIATNPFSEHLISAHRVICDFPSTGFYESVVAGVPTISLYHKALIVRESAVVYFGNLLKQFTDFSEAIKHVDEFLNSDPDIYTMSIDLEEGSLLDILEQNNKSSADFNR